MNCAVHTDVPATGFCRNCGKALCPQCTREVRGALYCEDCLAGLLGAPPAKGLAQIKTWPVRSKLGDQRVGATRSATRPEKTDGSARSSWGLGLRKQ